MKKLSKREKTLLLVLLLVVIIAGGVYFVIMPTVDWGDAMETRLAEQQATYSEMRLKAAQLPVLKERRETSAAELEKAEARQSAALTNEELDDLLTRLVLDAGLAPQAMMLGDAGWGSVPQFDPDGTPEGEEAPQAGLICQNQAMLTARGDLDGAQALIAAITGNEAMLLTACDAELDENELGDEVYEINVILTVFMRQE